MGWLSSNIKLGTGDNEKTEIKAKYYGEDSVICSMPSLGEFEYMLHLWDEVGRCKSTGFGVEPITWQEIESYGNKNRVGNWELLLLHHMSKAFVDARSTYDEVRCEPPYMPDGWDFKSLSAQAADAKLLAKK